MTAGRLPHGGAGPPQLKLPLYPEVMAWSRDRLCRQGEGRGVHGIDEIHELFIQSGPRTLRQTDASPQPVRARASWSTLRGQGQWEEGERSPPCSPGHRSATAASSGLRKSRPHCRHPQKQTEATIVTNAHGLGAEVKLGPFQRCGSQADAGLPAIVSPGPEVLGGF